MLELLVGGAVQLLGKIGYDVWQRRWSGPPPSQAVIGHEGSLRTDDLAAYSMYTSMTQATISVSFFPADNVSGETLPEHLPVALVMLDLLRPEIDGVAVMATLSDTVEIDVPGGAYSLVALVLTDDADYAQVVGIGWEEGLRMDSGADIALELAIISGHEDLLYDLMAGRVAVAWLVTENGQRWAIPAGTVTIGRSPENTFVANDPLVSAHHARILNSSDGFVLQDLSSRNGTYVNGRAITNCRLEHGDEIVLGQVILTFLTSG